MAKQNDGLSGLAKRLSSSKVSGISLRSLITPASVIAPAQNVPESSSRIPRTNDIRTLSFGAHTVATGIQFGKPANTRTSASQSSNQLTGLLKQTASGGIASILSGGIGGLGGLGGVVSGIMSLFGGGGKSTPPPLVEFQLPESQQETVYVSSTGSSSSQSGTVQPSPALTSGSSSASVNTLNLQYQSSQIAQAVKTALLNSSSLNDVIADI